MSQKISRRDFLKMMGAGVLVLAAGRFIEFLPADKMRALEVKKGYAQSGSPWSIGPDSTTSAIHAALLHNGKILYVAGSGYHTSFQNGPFEARLVDPISGQESNVDINEDLFCCGHAHLESGNVLIAGGTKDWDTVAGDGKWHGLSSAYEFDVASGLLVKLPSMAHGRWYPTCVTMSTGKVAVYGGYDEFGSINALTEIYDPSTKSFSIKYDSSSNLTYCAGNDSTLPGAGSPCYGGTNNGVNPFLSLYPRMHLMPSGLVVTCGMSRTMRTWDPSNGRWRWMADMVWPGWRSYGTSVLLPLQNSLAERGKILLAGGSIAWDTPGTNHCEILDFNASVNNFTPTIRSNSSMYMSHGRRLANPVILPNGKIAIFGGAAIKNEDPVMNPEQFDPITEKWTVLPTQTVPRVYHSVALLLPDGRVWTAGSTASRHDWELRTEYFSPDYLLGGPRPTIIGEPIVGGYGGTITIPASDATNITSVSLVRVSDMTHHYNTEQRLIWLNILSANSNSLTVSAPLNGNLAPPGYYMLHVLNSSNVPSAGKIIRMPGNGSVSVDNAPPILQILSPSAGSMVLGPPGNFTVNVAGTASDVGSGVENVIVKVGSNPYRFASPGVPGNWSNWSFSDVVSVTGVSNIKVIATDKKNNKSSVSIPITLAVQT